MDHLDPRNPFHRRWIRLVGEIDKMPLSRRELFGEQHHRKISSYYTTGQIPKDETIVELLDVLRRKVGHLLSMSLDQDEWLELARESRKGSSRAGHQGAGGRRVAARDDASLELLRNTVGPDGNVLVLGARVDQSVELGVSTGVDTEYILRSGDEELQSAIRNARQHGGFVIVCGQSGAGLTRAAYEAATSELEGFPVVVPAGRGPDLFTRLAAECPTLPQLVLWLDRLDDYLPRPNGQGCPGLYSLLGSMMERPNSTIIVATISNEAARSVAGTSQRQLYSEAAGILFKLGRSQAVKPPSRYSAQDLARADPHIARALNDASFQPLPRKVATLISLERAYGSRSGLPGTLVDALVDLRRIGWHGAVPESLLRSACCCYEGHHIDYTDDEWATAVIEVCGDGQGPVRDSGDGYRIKGYVHELAEAEGSWVGLHPRVWDAILAAADVLDPVDVVPLAGAALDRFLLVHALDLYRLAAQGEPYAREWVAQILCRTGRHAELRKLADDGDSYAVVWSAVIMVGEGDDDGARRLLGNSGLAESWVNEMRSDRWLSMLLRCPRGHDLDSADRAWMVRNSSPPQSRRPVARGIRSTSTSRPRMAYTFPVPTRSPGVASASILRDADRCRESREFEKAMRILRPLLASHVDGAIECATKIGRELRPMPIRGPVDRAQLTRSAADDALGDDYDISHHAIERVLRQGQFEFVGLLVESWERLGLTDRTANLLRFGFTTSGEIAVPHGTDSEDSP